VVPVTTRSTPALTQLFDDTNIDWSVVERQLVEWGELFRAGKKLKLNLSFNYEDAPQPSTTSLQRTEKGGRLSRTQRMLAERDKQVGAEEAASGQPSIWATVYRFFRCPGPPCKLGPYCWVRPDDRKHYKLLGPDIESLVEYKQQCHGRSDAPSKAERLARGAVCVLPDLAGSQGDDYTSIKLQTIPSTSQLLCKYLYSPSSVHHQLRPCISPLHPAPHLNNSN